MSFFGNLVRPFADIKLVQLNEQLELELGETLHSLRRANDAISKMQKAIDAKDQEIGQLRLRMKFSTDASLVI